MKNPRAKIIVALIAFLLGIASVWVAGGFSYFASLFGHPFGFGDTSANK
jgi:uncharacterized membrane protein YkvI